jgi:hypothetical protein
MRNGRAWRALSCPSKTKIPQRPGLPITAAPPMDLTPELVALCERKIEEPGPDPH